MSMTRKEAKKAFGQIEYPKDQIGTVFFAVVRNNNVEIRTHLIQNGDYTATIDEIYDENQNAEIIFQKKKIHDKVIECLKNDANLPTDLIYDVYTGTENEEYKKYIEDNNYIKDYIE